jgi:2-polyprenyl-6-methoxyphenol hydroxylase-like FAD-dependent oxidoreductase
MRAIIIGGGIGGLTAAVALRRKGIEAAVYEKSPELREVGAGISLWPNAVKALRKLGLGDALDVISLVNQDGAVRRWNGTILSRTPTRELQRRFGGGVIVLHRAELLDLLAHAVDAGTIHLGHTCTSIEQDASGVTATFANGATARGDLLIGADGLHSMVRAWLGHNTPMRYSGYTAWRAVVPFDTVVVKDS